MAIQKSNTDNALQGLNLPIYRDMIVITGAAGFIGSCLAKSFNNMGRNDLILVDDFTKTEKEANLLDVRFNQKIDRKHYVSNLEDFPCETIFHMGARTDTTEFDIKIFDNLNLSYSKAIWAHAAKHTIPLIYASSAATYGDGTQGFDDNPQSINTLRPLNPYGQSKHDFDIWAMQQTESPPFWVGLKFFNVFGPNEYHKGRMASVVYHTYHQIQKTGAMKLFQSHNPNFGDGEQSRDFIYINDLLQVIHFWHQSQQNSGVYNLGTGTARTFHDLAKAVFVALDMQPNITFIPTPEDLRETYQYYTCAEMTRTLAAGYDGGFMSLETAVTHYVQNHLKINQHF